MYRNLLDAVSHTHTPYHERSIGLQDLCTSMHVICVLHGT